MTVIEQEGPVEDGVPGSGRVSGRRLRELLDQHHHRDWVGGGSTRL